MLARQGRLPEALSLLQKAHAKNPGSDTYRSRVAVCHELAGTWEEAVHIMQDLLRQSPDNPSALNFVGYVLAERGIRLAEAEQHILSALAFRPLDGYILDSLGWTYFRMGRLEEARATLARADRLSPHEPEILRHLGEVFLALGNRAQAREVLLRALQHRPEPKIRRDIERLLRQTQGIAPKADPWNRVEVVR